MTRDELSALLAGRGLTLPAKPGWAESESRASERRATLPVYREGIDTGLKVVVVVFLNDRAYLVINLIAASRCVSRLCMTGGHRDLRTMSHVEGPHFHPWPLNLPKIDRIPKNFELKRVVRLDPTIITHDQAFDFFLSQLGIDSPRWRPMAWPYDQGFF
jgi:hypothetical protein